MARCRLRQLGRFQLPLRGRWDYTRYGFIERRYSCYHARHHPCDWDHWWPMSQPKAAVTTFNTGWQNIKSWAKQQNLPDTAVNNVYALDQQRISSGSYAMSNAERTRAILAAAGQNYNTALPTDAPSASDVLGNTVRNVKAIATGLQPTRLVGNIWDTLKTSAGDVGDLLTGHAGRMGKGSWQATAGDLLSNTALSWVPGAYDVGKEFTAESKGKNPFEALAQDPVTSALDILPFGKVLDAGVGTAVAKTSIGDALAARTGIAKGVLAHEGALRLGGMALGSIKIGQSMAALRDEAGNPVLDSAGLPTCGPRTIAQRASEAATKMGTGKLLLHVATTVDSILSQKSHEFELQTKGLVEKVGKLTPDKKGPDGSMIQGTHSQWNQLMHSGREPHDLMNDSSIPVEVREAVRAYQPWLDWHKEVSMEAGSIQTFTHADGTTSLYESSSGVFPAKAKAEAAQAKSDAANAKSDELLGQASALDGLHAPVLAQIDKTKTVINGSIAMSGKMGVGGVGKVKMFGRLVGRDGLLDKIDAAAKAQDWVALRNAASKASKVFTNKTAQEWTKVPQLAELKTNLDRILTYARVRAQVQTKYQRAYYGGSQTADRVSAATRDKQALLAHKKFLAYVKAHQIGRA